MLPSYKPDRLAAAPECQVNGYQIRLRSLRCLSTDGSLISALDTDRLSKVHDSLADFTQTSQQLSSLLQQSGADGNAGDLAQTTARMEELLDRVLAWVAEFKTKVGGVQAEVAMLRARALHWIRIGPIVLTAVFVWVAISQLGLIAYLRSWFRSV